MDPAERTEEKKILTTFKLKLHKVCGVASLPAATSQFSLKCLFGDVGETATPPGCHCSVFSAAGQVSVTLSDTKPNTWRDGGGERAKVN